MPVPRSGKLPEDVFQVIQDELLLDGNARQNLATFCQTWEEPEIHKIMDLAIDKNMVDKDEYPLTPKSNRGACTCLRICGTPLTPPIRSGRPQSCMLGGVAMKWRWRARGPLALLSLRPAL
jgi:glutamate decarboxylase